VCISNRMRGGTNQGVVNYVTGKPNTTRKNRVAKMTETKIQPGRVEKPTGVWNRFSNLFSDPPLQSLGPTKFKKTSVGGKRNLTEYQLRALSELSYRSPKVVQSNLKTLRNKPLAKRLRGSIQNTRKQR
jgi:hypothetical protein